MKNLQKRFLHNPNFASVVSLTVLYLIMFVLFSTRSVTFLSLGNFSNIFVNVAELGIMAIGVAMVVTTDHIDLSISSTYCFSGLLIGKLMMADVPLVAALLIALAVSAMVGVLNGVFIGYMDLQPVLVTVATQTLVRGCCYLLANESAVSIRGIVPTFQAFCNYKLFGFLSMSFVVLILLLLLFNILLNHTRFGIMLKSVGNNPETTRLTGYNCKRNICGVYTINSCLVWLAGMFMIMRLSGIEATYGNGFDFTVLTIVLMGGFSFGGGKGNSFVLLLGILAYGIMQNGMNLMDISTLYQSAIIGVVVLLLIAKPDIIGMRNNILAKREVERANKEYRSRQGV